MQECLLITQRMMRLLSVPSFVRVPKHSGVRCSRSIIWAFNGNKRIHPRGRTLSHSGGRRRKLSSRNFSRQEVRRRPPPARGIAHRHNSHLIHGAGNSSIYFNYETKVSIRKDLSFHSTDYDEEDEDGSGCCRLPQLLCYRPPS